MVRFEPTSVVLYPTVVVQHNTGEVEPNHFWIEQALYRFDSTLLRRNSQVRSNHQVWLLSWFDSDLCNRLIDQCGGLAGERARAVVGRAPNEYHRLRS